VFTAQYALSPYIKQTHFFFKGLNNEYNENGIIEDYVYPIHHKEEGCDFVNAEMNCYIPLETKKIKTSNSRVTSSLSIITRQFYAASFACVFSSLANNTTSKAD
jgi:hypothetical protein